MEEEIGLAVLFLFVFFWNLGTEDIKETHSDCNNKSSPHI